MFLSLTSLLSVAFRLTAQQMVALWSIEAYFIRDPVMGCLKLRRLSSQARFNNNYKDFSLNNNKRLEMHCIIKQGRTYVQMTLVDEV